MSMAERLSAPQLRELLGVEVSDTEATVLVDAYVNQARDVAEFPASDLKRVEPALRSVPGPILADPAR